MTEREQQSKRANEANGMNKRIMYTKRTKRMTRTNGTHLEPINSQQHM